MKEKFYITTPIYYPSSKLTLGNCYTTIICDAIARFNRYLGKDVFYLTGTDEHGQKIERKAKEANKSEMEFLDEIIDDTKKLWKLLDISYDDFIRTTDERHIKSVEKIVQKLYDNGDIYKDTYKGLYCTPCEAFWTESQLIDGKCPDCGREVEETEEESYFFKLSKYEDRIKELYAPGKKFLQPESRANEMLNNFLNKGLKDLCITRASVKWGIKVPFDHKHTIYVWVDALSNYITALGYLSDDDTLFKKYWPADVHVVGKEIVRFHAIIWPALLMALDLPLPKTIFGHGWLLFGGDKLSKSKGTILKDVIDPRVLCDRYSSDAVRCFLIKEIPFGNDGPYNQEIFLKGINNNLSNDIGNLVSRTISMVDKYFEGYIPVPNIETELDKSFKNEVLDLINKSISDMEELKPSSSIEDVINIFSRANKYVDETEPWNLAKNDIERLKTVLYNLCEVTIKGCTLLLPFLTKNIKNAFIQFGVEEPNSFEGIKDFNTLKSGIKVNKKDPLYPRLDIEKELIELEKIANEKE